MHEVLRILADRAAAKSTPGQRGDDWRVALAIEGGGMRGTISAGMAHMLSELGLVDAFDAVYGSSAGAITAAWLLSSWPDGLRGWAEPDYAKALIRRSRLLAGKAVVDVEGLIEVIYQTEWPMDFGSVLANPVQWHPLATDAATGASTDLRPLIGDDAEVRLAMRASACMPLLAGPPIALGGRRFYDAGVAESIPYRTALAQGATHVLVLRSRRPVPDIDDDFLRPSRSNRLLARTTLRAESQALRDVLLARPARLAADDRRLTEYQDQPAGTRPAVYSVVPAADAPLVSRLARDGQLLAAAFEAGRIAMRDVAGDLASRLRVLLQRLTHVGVVDAKLVERLLHLRQPGVVDVRRGRRA
jgi:predicted patatin/cPLA2 family phospholipase